MKALLLFTLLSLPAFAASPGSSGLTHVSSADAPELSDPALHPATREFGATIIPMGSLPLQSTLESAAVKPWSSYWFPKIDKDLFEGEDSPLAKYDLVRSTLNDIDSRAAQAERAGYRSDGPKWEGLCDAWAIAAILFPEPTEERSLLLNGGHNNFHDQPVTFSVGDQKALLLKSVEAISADSLKVYGQKFMGDFEAWIYPDLFPEELHRFVEKQIFERHQPFVMDHDPGIEVWNEPVYKANYVIAAVPGREDAVFVRLWLYSASPLRRDEKDKVGTKDVAREYNYYLYGKPDGQGNLAVDSGEWAKGELVDSRRDHPDYVFTISDPSAVKRQSNNKELDPAVVDQILGR